MLLVVAATRPELRGVDDRDDVETLICGVGPVDSAIAVARRLALGPTVPAIIHVGIAGAWREAGIPLGSLIIGSAASYRDSESQLVARHCGPDSSLLQRARVALPTALVRPIATSASVGGASGSEVEAMEGFSVLRAAALAGVPAIEVRSISNEVEEDDRGAWRFDLALEALAHALPTLVAALDPAIKART